MFFSADYNIYVNSDLFSTDRVFSFVVFLCFFAYLVIQAWMTDIKNLGLSVGYFCIPVNILELCVTWKQFDPFGYLLRFIVRARAMFSLGLIITSVEARLLWAQPHMPLCMRLWRWWEQVLKADVIFSHMSVICALLSAGERATVLPGVPSAALTCHSLNTGPCFPLLVTSDVSLVLCLSSFSLGKLRDNVNSP